MEEGAVLSEPLAVKKPAALNLNTRILTFLETLIILMFLFLINCLLALLLFSWNASFLMGTEISARYGTIDGPISTTLAGIGAQLLSEYGSQTLSIFGLCLILAVAMLIRTGRVTMMSLCMTFTGSLFIFSLIDTFGKAYEVYLVMAPEPSKLRSKMVRILGYEFFGFYVSVLFGAINNLSPHYEKLHSEGKEVPWFFSAIVFKIKKTLLFENLTLNCENLTATARHLASYIYMIYMVPQLYLYISYVIMSMINIFGLVESFGSEKKAIFLILATGGVITGCICLSIIAISRPSFTELHSIFTRDMFVFTVSLFVAWCAIMVSQMVGFLVQMATGCSDAYAPIVYKTSVLSLLTAMMCACIHFKLTGTYFADLYTEFEKSLTPLPAPSAEDTTLLADTQPTDPCDIARLENVTEHNESWGPTGSIATTGTGTSRDNTSYRLLPDSEIGEMPMGAYKTSNSRTQCL